MEDDLAMHARPPAIEQPVPAPRALRTLAGLIDTALLGLVTALYVRRIWRSGKGGGQRPDYLQRWGRPLALALSLIDERLGTPGGWIVGLRTVDRRTGRRVALWRTLAVATTRAVTEAAGRRLVPAQHSICESEREEFGREPWRRLLAVTAPALLNSLLRRRLAPTVVVVSPRRLPHSP